MKKHEQAFDTIPRDAELDALRESSDPEIPHDLRKIILKQAHTELTQFPGGHKRFTKAAVGIGMAASVMLVVLLPHQSPEDNLKPPTEYNVAKEAAPAPAPAQEVDATPKATPNSPERWAKNDAGGDGSVIKHHHAAKAATPSAPQDVANEFLLSEAKSRQGISSSLGGEDSGSSETKTPGSAEANSLLAEQQKAMMMAQAKAEVERQQAEASARKSYGYEQHPSPMQKAREPALAKNDATRAAAPAAAMPPAPAVAAVIDAPRYSEVGTSNEGVAITPEHWMGLWQPQSAVPGRAGMGRWKIWPVVSANAVRNFKSIKITGALGNNQPDGVDLTTAKVDQGRIALEALSVDMTLPYLCKAGSCLTEGVKLPPEITRHLALEGISVILLP